jgi:hypothetical protein
MNRKRKELPVCAGLRHESGAIIAGRRHSDCFRSALSLGLDKNDLTQGFVTNHGFFVDRETAFRMMQEAGIESVGEGGYRGSQLFSEDLY